MGACANERSDDVMKKMHGSVCDGSWKIGMVMVLHKLPLVVLCEFDWNAMMRRVVKLLASLDGAIVARQCECITSMSFELACWK